MDKLRNVTLRVALVACVIIASLIALAITTWSSQAQRPQYTVDLLKWRRVPDPPSGAFGEYLRLAWFSDSLIVEYEDMEVGARLGFAYSSRLAHLDVATEEWTELRIPKPDPGCMKYAYQEPERLPDGRLGLIVRCDSDPVSFLDELYMIAYDPSNERLARLTHFALPSQHVGVGGYSWEPELERGITNDRNGVAERLYWLTPDAYEYAALGFSRAVTAVWEPNGHRIAFWGASEQGLQGSDKAKAIFDLYMMDEDGTNVRQVFTGFRYPYSMAWSPDASTLVFIGIEAQSGQQGIWRLDVVSKQLALLAQGPYRVVDISPAGEHIAAITEPEDGVPSEVRILPWPTMSGR